MATLKVTQTPQLNRAKFTALRTGLQPRWCPPQSDGWLMTDKQILSLKPVPRLEQVSMIR
jgi:hypothetical protein